MYATLSNGQSIICRCVEDADERTIRCEIDTLYLGVVCQNALLILRT